MIILVSISLMIWLGWFKYWLSFFEQEKQLIDFVWLSFNLADLSVYSVAAVIQGHDSSWVSNNFEYTL